MGFRITLFSLVRGQSIVFLSNKSYTIFSLVISILFPKYRKLSLDCIKFVLYLNREYILFDKECHMRLNSYCLGAIV
jgi:hypothetical protein